MEYLCEGTVYGLEFTVMDRDADNDFALSYLHDEFVILILYDAHSTEDHERASKRANAFLAQRECAWSAVCIVRVASDSPDARTLLRADFEDDPDDSRLMLAQCDATNGHSIFRMLAQMVEKLYSLETIPRGKKTAGKKHFDFHGRMATVNTLSKSLAADMGERSDQNVSNT